ncbi:hypothetical protein BABINDRAFT_124287 [Babjeviella inositovora NRRL Y-12698]|uniref:Uncharacterized protein n=1 Tax=Babjeviella inositovora NRRL Y-12698 TaxID=984486 RepID=A0A1E3QS63_9ASCO|nr:uncharacterized protein BABINDRAFT_124287 [Babjeviella inositovora NRRL Y-12698]ODQ80478.1 hypothetical protein BABINDRAFT_124287 [Babjeviella inositovora NRRL Y-12698]
MNYLPISCLRIADNSVENYVLQVYCVSFMVGETHYRPPFHSTLHFVQHRLHISFYACQKRPILLVQTLSLHFNIRHESPRPILSNRCFISSLPGIYCFYLSNLIIDYK